MAVTRVSLGAALLLGAAAISAAAGRHLAIRYEHVTAARVEAALAAVRLDWVEVAADGNLLSLTGRAPDGLARDFALETVRLAAPGAQISERLGVAEGSPHPAPRTQVEIHRDGDRVILLGRVPPSPDPERDGAESLPTRLAAALRSRAGAGVPLTIRDLTEPEAGLTAAPVPVELAAEAVFSVTRARVVLEPMRLSLTGLAQDEAAVQDIARRLGALTPEGIALALDIKVPPTVISPFTFRLAHDAEIGWRLLRCAARNDGEAARIETDLRAAGFVGVSGRCLVGAGGPPGDWPGAIDAALALVPSLPVGSEVTLDHRLARLSVPGNVPETRRAALGARLAGALPAGFNLRQEVAPARPDPGAFPPDTPLAAFWLEIAATPDSVALAGTVADPALAAAFEALAAARFPGRIVTERLTLRVDPAPEGWAAAVEAGMRALAGVAEGRLSLRAGLARLDVTLADPMAGRALHDDLAAALRATMPGTRLESAIRVDLPAAVAGLPVSGARCAVALGEILLADPLTFAPGSAVLEEPSGTTLDQLAQMLARCPEAEFEIGGHTDSQGSERFNLTLSAARAQAVREALIIRGAGPARLAAKGYGEARPVASNATEAGRARNRRIELAHRLPAQETVATGEPGATPQPVADEATADPDPQTLDLPIPIPAPRQNQGGSQ